MTISLVANIPDQLIIWSIVHIMQGSGQFHYAEAGAKMPAINAYYINNILTQFIAYLVQFFPG